MPEGRAWAATPAGADRISRQRSGRHPGPGKDQGIAVSARGRIPASVAEQYQATAQ